MKNQNQSKFKCRFQSFDCCYDDDCLFHYNSLSYSITIRLLISQCSLFTKLLIMSAHKYSIQEGRELRIQFYEDEPFKITVSF